MIRTIVCHEDKCDGNKFILNTLDTGIEITCCNCGKKYVFNSDSYDFKYLSSCSMCRNDSFKIFKDTENEKVYAKCIECGNPPEKVYVDNDGIQVSYEEKLLHDVKSLMQRIDQKIMNLEVNVGEIERGQQILEQSIAYINKFIVEEK
ncbi:MAG: hypothetical protein ACRC7N_18900 [Clostridium sp.]